MLRKPSAPRCAKIDVEAMQDDISLIDSMNIYVPD
jgi:hypothetical protein